MALSSTQSFDDSATMKLVLETHSPDAQKIDVKPLLDLIDNILHRATPSIDSVLRGTQNAIVEDKSYPAASVAVGEFASLLNKVSCELACKCCGDAHATAMEILKTLSKYSWDVKVVLTIAAFAVNYGEFGLFAQLYFANPLAKYIALLKQLPEIIEHGSALKPQFDAITTLINAGLDLTKCIVEFNDLNPKYVSPDKPPMSIPMADIHKHAYLIIISVVVCAMQIATLVGFTAESPPTYSISNLAVRVNYNLKGLRVQLDTCKKHIVDDKQREDYEKVVNVFKTSKLDKILICIFNLEDDSQTLVDNSGKKVEINVFHQKNVLLLISDLDVSKEETTALGNLYKEWQSQKQKKPGYEKLIVWLPVVDKSIWDKVKQKFDELRLSMPWYTVNNPTLIKPEVIRYITKEWNFSKKTILVPFNSKGERQSHHSLNMLWIWGTLDLPSTDTDEKVKWQEQSSPLDLIFSGIDNTSLSLIKKGEITVCFYGGDDIEWIKRFTIVTKKVAEIAGIKIELVYVVKRNATDKAKKNIDFINAHKLSRCWKDSSSIWLFWTRLESIFHSKTRIDISDKIMQEVITLLSFDATAGEKGWALFCKGSSMAKAKGDIDVVLGDLLKNEEWIKNAKNIEFMTTLSNSFEKLQTKHCNKFSFNYEIQGELPCYCGRTMKKFYTYSCCVDEHA